MFEKQRLSNSNISQYVGMQCDQPKLVPGVPVLAQNDYGEANDCTLTSITAVIKWLKPSVDINTIYNTVESIAKKYGYEGKKFGTPNLTIKRIYNLSLMAFKLNKKAHSRYLKNIGYGWSWIKKEIDEYQPVLLNLWADGRDFYKNHSILIVGYLEIADKRLLAVYDNWYKSVSYVDYDKLSIISSIDYLEQADV